MTISSNNENDDHEESGFNICASIGNL
jgi:hypothetical protein